MIGRKVLILLCAIGSFALISVSYAQVGTLVPLNESEKDYSGQILDEAQAAGERAREYARQNSFPQVRDAYEDFLDRWKGKSEILTTYPVLMALGGAHLEAAFARSMDAAKSRDLRPTDREANQHKINDHLGEVYTLYGNAARLASASGIAGSDAVRFRCVAKTQITAARSLEGIVNSSPDYLEQGIKGYEALETCAPGSKKAAQYLKNIKKDLTGGPMNADAIAKCLSLFVKETVPKGALISASIDIGYEFYKKYPRPTVDKILPRSQ